MLRRYLRQAVTLLGAARTDLVVCPVVHPSESLRHTLLSRARHFLLIGSFEYITFVFFNGLIVEYVGVLGRVELVLLNDHVLLQRATGLV